MKKDVVIHIRIDDQTYKKLITRVNAADGNLSGYVRNLILSEDKTTNPLLNKNINQLKREINKIGVNINQIVRNNNSELYSPEDKNQLFANLEDIIALFNEYKSSIFTS